MVSEKLKTITISVDSYDDLLIQGEIYHNSFEEGKCFSNLMQMLLNIEDILDEMKFPRPALEKRRFSRFDGMSNFSAASDVSPEFQIKTGKLSTFKVKVIFRQNASWQGSIAWIEGNSEEPFRSALELVFLMDSALCECKSK